MLDGPDSNALFFAGSFTGVIIVNDRGHGRVCCFIHFQVVDGDHKQETPGKAGTPLGHGDPVSMELAGIVYTGIQPKVSIELLRRGEPVKGSHFRDQDDGT